MAHRFRFFGTTPWLPAAASESELGPGTPYPVETALAGTCRLYWKPRRLRLSLSALHAGVSFGGSAIGEPRATVEPYQLSQTLEGVSVDGLINVGPPISGQPQFSFTFFIEADSVFNGERLQFLRMEFNGAISVPSSLAQVSSALPGFPAGTCYIDAFAIPLFSDIDGVVIDARVTWDAWEFDD